MIAVGDLRTVAWPGAAAPGGLGGSVHRLGAAAVNDRGVVAYAADIAGSTTRSAIVRVVDGAAEVVVRSGDPAPGGGRYARFRQLDLGEDGSLLFHAELAGCAATEGLFLGTADGVLPVARAGQPAPGGGRYSSFGYLTLTSYQRPSGLYFRLAFTAGTTTARHCLVIWPSYTDPAAVLTTATPVAGGTVQRFAVSRLGLALSVVAVIRHGNSRWNQALLVSEDQVIWDDRLRTGVPLADLPRVVRLRQPPAIHVCHGFLAVECADGTTALVDCPGAGDPQVFARSGDPAPGLPDRSIARFGPPLANHGLPNGGACGIASVTRLTDGRTALWLGTFHTQRPMAGTAILPVVTGQRTDDEDPRTVRSIAALKFTNTGMLLLRCALDDAGGPGGALLLLDGLLG